MRVRLCACSPSPRRMLYSPHAHTPVTVIHSHCLSLSLLSTDGRMLIIPTNYLQSNIIYQYKRSKNYAVYLAFDVSILSHTLPRSLFLSHPRHTVTLPHTLSHPHTNERSKIDVIVLLRTLPLSHLLSRYFSHNVLHRPPPALFASVQSITYPLVPAIYFSKFSPRTP